MSETFEKVLAKGDRLGCITSKVKFQMPKGGQKITCQPTLQSHLGDQSVSRVQRDGAELRNYYKQERSMAVSSDAEDHHYRQG